MMEMVESERANHEVNEKRLREAQVTHGPKSLSND